MKCREMNPGNSHSVARTISKAIAESCERSDASIHFREQHGSRTQKKTSNNGALAPRNLTASAPRENTRRFSSR